MRCDFCRRTRRRGVGSALSNPLLDTPYNATHGKFAKSALSPLGARAVLTQRPPCRFDLSTS